MQRLKDKTILIISPQSWGKMHVSKHHYATELAKYGNTVYFLNPPDKTLNERIGIYSDPVTPNLNIICHRINFPYSIKFHAIGVFHWLMKRQLKKILKKIAKPIDIVWSFDLGNLYPLNFFAKGTLIVFHPVDEPLNAAAIDSANGAQIILSVTNEILEKYKSHYTCPLCFINHGVSEIFFSQQPVSRVDNTIRVGFSGNLLRFDLDRPVLLQIIRENTSVIFECWGSYRLTEANIGGENDLSTNLFIKTLTEMPNVILHGAVAVEELAKAYQRMDAFLICYDIEKDQSKGTNYHKVMEFLATGKVIVSNNITTYKNRPGLIEMTAERNTNSNLPGLFKNVIANLSKYNSPESEANRIAFAGNNLYRKQIEIIEKYLIDLNILNN